MQVSFASYTSVNCFGTMSGTCIESVIFKVALNLIY